MLEGLPEALVKALQKAYDIEDLSRVEAGFKAQRPVTLRYNRLRTTPEEADARLAEAGLSFRRAPIWADALIMDDAREEALQALPLYEKGGIYLQSLSSMLPPLVLDAQAGENILDMAAAPGGKTTQIASMTGGRAMITACERNTARAEKLRFNLSRQGATRVTVMNRDARQLDDFFRFDRILLDAPCSGSGTCSLLPGARNGQFTDATLARCCKSQRELLTKALKLLPAGHMLVYSTCSILPMENEDIVRGALAKDAELVPIDTARFPGLPLLPNSLPGTLTICPDGLYEGFYVAALRKK